MFDVRWLLERELISAVVFAQSLFVLVEFQFSVGERRESEL